jgi:hypothetical protein
MHPFSLGMLSSDHCESASLTPPQRAIAPLLIPHPRDQKDYSRILVRRHIIQLHFQNR